MNRLVIIGNGFDLAHGLPTRYKNFVDDYWKNLNLQNHEDNFIRLDSAIDYKQKKVNDYNDFKILVEDFIREKYPTGTANSTEDIGVHISNDLPWKKILEFKNNFFKTINHKSIENWVDIENEYYSSLKEIIKSNFIGNTMQSKIKEAKKLNNEFEQVKNLLEKYLKEKVVAKYNFSVPDINEMNKFHNIFYPTILENSKIHLWKEDFSKEDKDYIDELINEGKQRDVKLRFLNFNYTPTLSSYFHMNRNLYND